MRLLLRRPIRSLAGDRRGVAAIEFAFVGLAFLTMTMFILDLGLQEYTQGILDTAARKAALNIKTDYGTSSGTVTVGLSRGAASDVTASVCSLLSLLAPACTTGLQVYVANGTSFASLSRVDDPVTGLHPPANPFLPGGSNAYVILQVAYHRNPVLAFNGFIEPYVISTVIFENEK